MPKNPTRKIIYICVGCGQSQANSKYKDEMIGSVSARERQPHTMKNDDCKIRNFSNKTRYNDVIIQIESAERLRNTIDSIYLHTQNGPNTKDAQKVCRFQKIANILTFNNKFHT